MWTVCYSSRGPFVTSSNCTTCGTCFTSTRTTDLIPSPRQFLLRLAFFITIHLFEIVSICLPYRGFYNGTIIKEGLYRIWCGLNTLGDSGVNTLGDTSAFVNPTVQLLLTRWGKIGMDGVGIVFEFYIAPL